MENDTELRTNPLSLAPLDSSPEGRASWQRGKVTRNRKSSPLGGAGCERSEAD